MENRDTPTPQERIRLEIAGALSALLSGSLYIVSTGAWGVIALLAVRAFGISGPGAALMLLLALAAGCMTGILVNYALTPTYLRWTFGAPARNGRMLERFVRRCLKEAHVEGIDVFIMRAWPGAARAADLRAMVGGILPAPRFLQRTLFLSEACADLLTLDELRALIFHEASHIRLSHLSRRGWFSFVALLGILALGTGALLAAVIAGFGETVTWLSPLIGLTGFAGAFLALRWQSRTQEMEADRFAVLALGADPEALSQVIAKSSSFAPPYKAVRRRIGVALGLETHPEPTVRIQALEELRVAREATPTRAA